MVVEAVAKNPPGADKMVPSNVRLADSANKLEPSSYKTRLAAPEVMAETPTVNPQDEASVPQSTTPLASVSRAVQASVKLEIRKPPPEIVRPVVIVEVADPVISNLPASRLSAISKSSLMVEVPVPSITKVDEAAKVPLTFKGPTTVEEPTLINPPDKVAKLRTLKEEDADNGPVTWS